MKKTFFLILMILCQTCLLSSCDAKKMKEPVIHNEVQGCVAYNETDIYYISQAKTILKKDRETQKEQELGISDVFFIKIQDRYLYYLTEKEEKNFLYTLDLNTAVIKEIYSFNKKVDSFKLYQNIAYFLEGSHLYQLDLIKCVEKQLPIECFMEFEVIDNRIYYQEILTGETERLSETFQLEKKQYKILCYDLDSQEKQNIVPVSETEARNFIQANDTLIYNRIGEAIHQVDNTGKDEQIVEASVSGLFVDDDNFIYYSNYSDSKVYRQNLKNKQKYVICDGVGISILLGITPNEVYVSELSDQLTYQNVWRSRTDVKI